MMSRKWVCVVCLGLLALSVIGSADVTDPNIISAASRVSGTRVAPVVVKGGLVNGVFPYVDRTYGLADVGYFEGLDFVQTSMDGRDKSSEDTWFQVTVDKPGRLFLFIDNRVGDGVATDPPTLTSKMTWVLADGFVRTNYALPGGWGAGEACAVYEKNVTAGTYILKEQNDGTGRAAYGIAAAPDGWFFPNTPPLIANVKSSYSVAPGATLSINADITDDGLPTPPGQVTVAWSVESTPQGASVTFDPDMISEDVTLSFSEMGNYMLKLAASDSNQVAEITIDVAVEHPKFAVQATEHLTIANDSHQEPTSHTTPTALAVRNYASEDGATTRRRLGYHKYDFSSLKGDGKVFANSYLTFNCKAASSTKQFYVYAINEDLDSFDLSESSANWVTAPGIQNEPLPVKGSEITINMLDKRDLQPLVMAFSPGSTGIHSTLPCPALDEILNADEDGTLLLMFVTYDPQNSDFEFYSISDSRTDPDSGKKGVVLKGQKREPVWASEPVPAINTNQSSSLSMLRWTNPAAVGNITCDVYIGTSDPNYLAPGYGGDFVALGTGIAGNSVSLSGYPLQPGTTYKWIVDVYDSGTAQKAQGFVWTFNAISNTPPVVTIDPPLQYLWLNNAGDPLSATAVVDASVVDDGVPGPYTLGWDQISAPDGVEIVIDPNDVEDLTLVLPKTGDYIFRLTASDGEHSSYSSVGIYVGATPCDAAKEKTGYQRMPADFDDNCVVNMADLGKFAEQWLACHPYMTEIGASCF